MEMEEAGTKLLKAKLTIMKKIFTLFSASLISLSLLAYDGSRLSISTPATNTELKVEIDGRQFSMKNNSLTLSYLGEGYHQVKIFRDKKKNGVSFGKKQDIIYSSAVYLKKGFHLDITVNRFGKAMTDERRIDVDDEWYNDEDEYYDSNNGGLDGGRGNVMTGREFETVKDQLRREWFENNRLSSAKFIIAKSDLTTQQVKELMLLFTFENNRVEIAKAAYCKTIDQKNYYLLNDALTFSSSKEDLARFIRDYR